MAGYHPSSAGYHPSSRVSISQGGEAEGRYSADEGEGGNSADAVRAEAAQVRVAAQEVRAHAP